MDIFVLTIVILFILGLIVGSFLNVVILRYNTGRTITGRSACLSCGTTLAWHELIPVISFFIQGGRCRSCGSRFSWQYPAVEVLTGVLFALVGFVFLPALTPAAVSIAMLYLIIVSLLVVIVVYDMRHKIIPDPFVFAFIALSAFVMFLDVQQMTLTLPSAWHILAGPLLASPFAFLWAVSKGRWMGFGDAKLALGIGWLLGLSAGFSALVLAFWIGALLSVLLVLLSTLSPSTRPRTMKSEVPFAPFLVLGTLLVLFFGIDVIALLTLLSL